MGNIISTILILAALGLTFGYTSPVYRGMTESSDFSDKSIKELQDEKLKYEEALQRTREIEEVKGGLLTKYNSVTELDRQKINKILPDNIDSIRLIIDISNIASSYGMQLRSISISESLPQTPRKDDPAALVSSIKSYSNVNLGFSVSGTYENLISFISDLEKNLRITDITRLSIDTANDVSDSQNKDKKAVVTNNYKMQVSTKTYYLISK